jgi:hypothetical protein
MSGEHKPEPLVKTEADERFPQVSSDGKWIAYQAPDAMGAPQVWVNSFPKAVVLRSASQQAVGMEWLSR